MKKRFLLLLMAVAIGESVLGQNKLIEYTVNVAEDDMFENALFPIESKETGTLYFVNIEGNRVSQDYDYGNGYFPQYNYAIVKRKQKRGIIDHNGQEVVPCVYDDLWFLKQGDIFVKNDEREGVVSVENKVVIPLEFKNIWSNPKGFVGEKNGKYAFYNKKGQRITREFDGMSYNWNVDLLEVRENHKTGFIDCSGKIVIPIEYEEGYTSVNGSYFENGLAPLKKDSELYLVNTKGNKSKIGTYNLPSLGMISENMLRIVKKVGEQYLYGFANTDGKIVVPCKYVAAGDFSDGLAYVRSNDEEYAYINKKGEEVLHLKYKGCPAGDVDVEGYNFCYGLAPYKLNEDQYGYINKKGDIVITPNYGLASVFDKETGTAWVANSGYGLIDSQGNEILECQWEYPGFGFPKCSFIEDDESHGLYDMLAKEWIIPGEYILHGQTFIPTIQKVCRNRNKDLYGYYDTMRKEEIIPCIYTEEEACWKFVEFCQSQVSIDIEKNIPQTSPSNKASFAVIISNENYAEAGVANVDYAKKDGEVFKEYCLKTLGLPEKNIHYRQDATLNQIRSEVRWIGEIAKAFGDEANVIFYYTGHGIPDETGGDAYLLPVDGIPAEVESSYSLSSLYHQLGSLPVKQTTVFLDACFSGAQRNGDMLVAAKGIAVRAKTEVPIGNMVVLTASQGDETAHFYKKKKHGLFTYYLLKKLKDSKGECTLSELGEYIKKEVAKYSIVENGKSQTPTISASPVLGERWKSMRLK